MEFFRKLTASRPISRGKLSKSTVNYLSPLLRKIFPLADRRQMEIRHAAGSRSANWRNQAKQRNRYSIMSMIDQSGIV